MRFFLSILALMFFIFLGNNLYSASVKLEIKDIKYVKGKLFIGLANDPDIFPRVRSSYKWVEVKVEKDSLSYTFKGIPSGLYAISIFHDVNNNRRFDRAGIGIPTEPFGFSNNVLGFLGPPSFKAASFSLEGKELKVLKIELKEAL